MLAPDDPAVEAATTGRGRAMRSMGWAALDQAVSSTTNFGITLVAARELSRTGFGAFGLVLSVYVVAVGLTRGLVMEPLLSRPELAGKERRRSVFAAVAGASVALGCLVAAALLAGGLLFASDLARGLLALALLFPLLCLQDAWRYCFISQQQAALAVVNDGVWLLVQVLGVVWLAATGRWSPAWIVLVWGGAGGIAALVGCLQARVLPHVPGGRDWLRDQWDLGSRYCLEFVTSNGATQLALMGLGAVAGLAALGAVRGAQTFYGPLGVLFSSIILAVVPGATTLRDAPARLRRLLTLISAAVCVAALAWTVVGVALPGSIGRALFGVTWESTRKVVLPMGLALVASGVAAGPYAGLRSLAAAREGLHVRLFSSPLIIGGPLAGAALAGATGFAYGLAAATVAMAGIYWWKFAVASARYQGGP